MCAYSRSRATWRHVAPCVAHARGDRPMRSWTARRRCGQLQHEEVDWTSRQKSSLEIFFNLISRLTSRNPPIGTTKRVAVGVLATRIVAALHALGHLIIDGGAAKFCRRAQPATLLEIAFGIRDDLIGDFKKTVEKNARSSVRALLLPAPRPTASHIHLAVIAARIKSQIGREIPNIVAGKRFEHPPLQSA